MWLLTSCSPIILAERRQRKSLGRICDVDASWHISVKSQICMFRPSCSYSATKVKLQFDVNFPMQPGSFQHDLGWVLTFLLWRWIWRLSTLFGSFLGVATLHYFSPKFQGKNSMFCYTLHCNAPSTGGSRVCLLGLALKSQILWSILLDISRHKNRWTGTVSPLV